jgi:iron complex outermembrane receptor protein
VRSLSLALGSFDSSEYGGHLSHAAGPIDFLISAKRRETDGFRDNADGNLRRLAAGIGFDLSGERRLELTLIDSKSDYGNPGALTRSEFEQDPSVSPFNALDFADERLELASLNFRGPVAERLSVAANLFARNRETASLSTGRAAAVIGGFALDSEAAFWGSTVQVTHRYRTGSRVNLLTFGGEWLGGNTESLGYATSVADPGVIPPAPSTDTTSDRRTSALFVQDTWIPARDWTLTAGARYDHDRVGLNESLPDPANDDSRRFSELSLRAGATWSPDDHHALYVSYGEGFLPPTSEDLFAFPGFGSNPGLEPEDARSYEVGFRGRWSSGLRLDAGLFRIDTEDEIVFDPDSPIGPFGANVNAGRTRRQGVEISLRGRLLPKMVAYAELTLTDALDVDLPAGLALHADAMYVGEQVLDNDDSNLQPELDDYVVLSARARWRLDSVTTRRSGLQLYLEVRNLLDEEYATRGIYAYDFSTGMSDIFLTPAPGRRTLFGVEWDF